MKTSRERRSSSGQADIWIGRMDQTLHAVDGHRCVGIGDIEDAFDAQHPIAMAVEQHAEPQAEQRPVDRTVERQREGVDRLVVAIAVGGFGGVVGSKLGRKPASRRLAAAGRREQVMRQQRRGIEWRLGGSPQRRRRIDATEPLDQGTDPRRPGKIGLGQDQAIGDGDLLGAFGLTGELAPSRSPHRRW